MHYHYRQGVHKQRRFHLYFIPTVALITGFTLFFSPTQQESEVSVSQPVIATPVAQAEPVTPQVPKTVSAALPWPSYGHAAYAVQQNEVIAASDAGTEAVPIASLAKVITALAVLDKKPLAPGEKGPMITFTQNDVALYQTYLQKDGAVVPVAAGQQLSQYDALQAMMMASANNVSDTLVIWAFGSMEAYTNYANNMVRELGLTKTTIDDASGFSPSTKSTAPEMTILGIKYIENPVLREIAMKDGAEIAGVGYVPNYNTYLNDQNAIGIKVGNTDEAKRCFMIADLRAEKGFGSKARFLFYMPRHGFDYKLWRPMGDAKMDLAELISQEAMGGAMTSDDAVRRTFFESASPGGGRFFSRIEWECPNGDEVLRAITVQQQNRMELMNVYEPPKIDEEGVTSILRSVVLATPGAQQLAAEFSARYPAKQGTRTDAELTVLVPREQLSPKEVGGAAMYSLFTTGEAKATEGGSITEGIGLGRVTPIIEDIDARKAAEAM